ncbi:MAG: WXG100 family type VII secretion target [Oscillospiraceae bacterium]|nr:WXG100 family type VII secretion target [Oscillospiraceae bacterium]
MAEIIKVSTEEMRETVTQFVSAQSALQSAYEWMDRAVKVLDSCWKGAAYTAMRTQWSLTYKNIEQANERMQDAIDELNKSADLFDASETGLTSIFTSLDTGTSPFE